MRAHSRPISQSVHNWSVCLLERRDLLLLIYGSRGRACSIKWWERSSEFQEQGMDIPHSSPRMMTTRTSKLVPILAGSSL